MRVAIIGGGLAGCAAAYMLRRAGAEPVIYEAGPALASGASGNMLGLYNPRLSAQFSPEAQYYAGAFMLAREVFAGLEGIEWNPCGALHLITDEKKEKRLRGALESWGWGEEDMKWLGSDDASAVAGVSVPYEALYLPASGSVSPVRLCGAYTQGVEVHLNTPVFDLETLEAEAVILACGGAVKDFIPGLPLQSVRGQVTHVKSQGPLAGLKTCLCYGGYVSPAQEGVHMVGSTFQRWLAHTDILPEDDGDNLRKLGDAVPALGGAYEIVGHRAALRTASRDQFPVVGAVPGREGVYVSTAHGSHGIISSMMAAQLLAGMISAGPPALPERVIECLNPARFL